MGLDEAASLLWHDLRERVDHGGHRGLVSGADVVKVQHALHSPGLHAPHNGLGVAAEEGGILSWWAKTQRVHPGHTHDTPPYETRRGRGRLPDPSTSQVQGGWLIRTTKGHEEGGILRTLGGSASISSGKR